MQPIQMAVVCVTELPDISPKDLKSDLGLSQPVTDLLNKSYINETSTTTTSDRVLLLLDAILTDRCLSPEGTDLFYEKRTIRILQFFTNKYHSKVMYCILLLNFSSYWELSINLNLNMDMLRRSISDLEQCGIVVELRKDDHRYIPITKYWKSTYPTSPNIPILFMLNPHYARIVEMYQEDICQRYITNKEYSYLRRRGNEYKRYYERLKKQLSFVRKKEDESIGRCRHCGKLIINTAIRGRDYHKFTIGLICNSCRCSATKELMKKWMHKNK